MEKLILTKDELINDTKNSLDKIVSKLSELCIITKDECISSLVKRMLSTYKNGVGSGNENASVLSLCSHAMVYDTEIIGQVISNMEIFFYVAKELDEDNLDDYYIYDEIETNEYVRSFPQLIKELTCIIDDGMYPIYSDSDVWCRYIKEDVSMYDFAILCGFEKCMNTDLFVDIMNYALKKEIIHLNKDVYFRIFSELTSFNKLKLYEQYGESQDILNELGGIENFVFKPIKEVTAYKTMDNRIYTQRDKALQENIFDNIVEYNIATKFATMSESDIDAVLVFLGRK